MTQRAERIGRKYYVTIDREEFKNVRRWQFWSKFWWIKYSRRADKLQGIGRNVYEIDRETGNVRLMFKLPQELDRSVWNNSWMNQNDWTKSFTRGLRAITPLIGGGFVINDIFGVYQVSEQGVVQKYVTRPIFADVHCAKPNANNTRLLVTSTGTEEIFEIDWEGTVHNRIFLPDVFGLPPNEEVSKAKEANPDHRMIQLNHSREYFHVNWAQWIEEGKSMFVSLHGVGQVSILDIASDGSASVSQSWGVFPQCHGPSFDFKRSSLLVAVSKANQVREVSLTTGRPLWVANKLSYSKRILAINDDVALACDCNGKRIVEIDRNSGAEMWSCNVPGLPYDVAFRSENG